MKRRKIAAGEAEKERVTESEDFISSLPDPILCAIVSLLLGGEGVRTCVLSRRWKNVWKHASHLHLDLTQLLKPLVIPSWKSHLRLIMKSRYMNDPSREWVHHQMVEREKYKKELELVIAEEERLVNSVLDSHFGPLESCSVRYSRNYFMRGEAWIKRLFEEKKIKKLSIDMEDGHCGNVSIICLDIPLEIFSGFETLELKNCYLRAESLKVWPRFLRTLTFKKMHVNESIWNEIMSDCLCLENLTLDDCKSMQVVKIDSPRLKFLKICRMVMSMIVVCAVNLEVLEIDGVVCETQNLIIEAPKVHVLRSSCDSKTGVQYVCWLRNMLLQSRNTLHNHSSNQSFQGSTSNFATIFENVTTVGIDLDLKGDKNVITLLHAIKSCPKLQNLEINSQATDGASHYYCSVYNNEDFLPYPESLSWTTRDLCTCIEHQLKTLSIKGFEGEELEVEFLRHLITTVSVLEKIRIWFVDDCSWSRVMQTRSLLVFPKASPNLSIILYPGPVYMANVDNNFETWISTLRNW